MVEEDARALVQRIGALSRCNDVTCHALGTIVLAFACEQLGSNRLPRESRVEIVRRCGMLCRARPFGRLRVPPLRVERLCELAGPRGERHGEARTAKQLAALEQCQLGGVPIAGERVDGRPDLAAQRRGKTELPELVEDLARACDEGAALGELPPHREKAAEEDQHVRLACLTDDVFGEETLAPVDRLRRGCRAPVERLCKLAEACRRRPAGALVRLERAFARLLPDLAAKVAAAVHVARQEPGSSERALVLQRLESRDRGERGLEELLPVRGGILEETEERQLHPCAKLDVRIADRRGCTCGDGERSRRPPGVASGEQCETELARQLSRQRGIGRKEARRALQQPDGRVHVVAPPCEQAGRAESRTRVRRELAQPPLVRTELHTQPICALEVEADELVGLVPSIEVIGQPLVQLGTEPLRRAAIDGVVDQPVAEPEPRLGEPQEAATDQDVEVRSRRRRGRRVEQLRHVAGREVAPDDGGALEHAALAGPEPVETRGEQRPQRRRRLEQAGLSDVRDELLEEERISLGRCDEPTAGLLVEDGIREQMLDERVRLRIGERLEDEALCGKDLGPVVAELVPGEAHEQDRRAAGRRRQLLDDVDERRLRPVQVVEREHERSS